MNYQDFRDYVFAQSEDREILHDCWCKCAVGDAYYHLNPEEEPDNKDESVFQPDVSELLDANWSDEHHDLYLVLNNNGLVQRRWPGHSILSTYGDLQRYITHLGI